MTQDEALKLALEELADRFSEGWHEGIKIDASDIMLLSKAAEALAQEQEPVIGTKTWFEDGKVVTQYLYPSDIYTTPPQPEQEPVVQYIGVYTTPPQRKPLTDEEIEKCYETTGHYQTLRPQDRFAVFALARAIEAAHGIKENT